MHGVVEGEPGIFPDPVARLMRAVGGLFGGRRRGSRDRQSAPGERAESDALDAQAAPTEPGDRSGPEVPTAQPETPAGDTAADAFDERSGADKTVE